MLWVRPVRWRTQLPFPETVHLVKGWGVGPLLLLRKRCRPASPSTHGGWAPGEGMTGRARVRRGCELLSRASKTSWFVGWESVRLLSRVNGKLPVLARGLRVRASRFRLQSHYHNFFGWGTLAGPLNAPPSSPPPITTIKSPTGPCFFAPSRL